MTRTSNYRFTVKMENGKPTFPDSEVLLALRNHIKAYNKTFGTRKYVKLQGRGPRPSNRYHQSLPLSMATSADVYVYSR